MDKVTEALEIIQQGYERVLKEKQEAYVCQLTNNNQGFNTWEIDAIKQEVIKLRFALPVHISILPIGKQPTSRKLFDGLIDIYCNNQALQKMVVEMKKQPR
jgi:RecB family endonuclease NucS